MRIDGERAILAKGPAPGTAVVTVGATELWGVEYGGIEETDVRAQAVSDITTEGGPER